jgi:hypothetical protein
VSGDAMGTRVRTCADAVSETKSWATFGSSVIINILQNDCGEYNEQKGRPATTACPIRSLIDGIKKRQDCGSRKQSRLL